MNFFLFQQTLFVLDGNKLVQTQKDPKDGNLVCTITREILEDGQLKTVAKAGSVEAIRMYSRDQQNNQLLISYLFLVIIHDF